jgi:hypothetical protein
MKELKRSEFEQALEGLHALRFRLPNGKKVPAHFHLTEVGLTTKRFIDCGGTARTEEVVSMQLYVDIDLHHRLRADKFLGILKHSTGQLGLPDQAVEVEYQGETIGRYRLGFDGEVFHLIPQKTACLAKEQCGIPLVKPKVKLADRTKEAKSCLPGSGCC